MIRTVKLVKKIDRIKATIKKDLSRLIEKKSLVKNFVKQDLGGFLHNFSEEFFDDMISHGKFWLEYVDDIASDVNYTDKELLEPGFFEFEYFSGTG